MQYWIISSTNGMNFATYIDKRLYGFMAVANNGVELESLFAGLVPLRVSLVTHVAFQNWPYFIAMELGDAHVSALLSQHGHCIAGLVAMLRSYGSCSLDLQK